MPLIPKKIFKIETAHFVLGFLIAAVALISILLYYLDRYEGISNKGI